MSKNIDERKFMLLAMEFICRQINDEDVFEGWLMEGVPDGDIPYWTTDISIIDDDDSMLEDESFREIMECFLRCMRRADKSGGLYCDGVVGGGE